MKKEEVKVEVEERRVLQISGERSKRRRTTNGIAWRGATESSFTDLSCQKMQKRMKSKLAWRMEC